MNDEIFELNQLDFLETLSSKLKGVETLILEFEGRESGTEPVILELLERFQGIKSDAGFWDFQKVATLCHRGENALDLLRAGRLKPSSSLAEVIRELVETLRDIGQGIEAEGKEHSTRYAQVSEKLSTLIQESTS